MSKQTERKIWLPFHGCLRIRQTVLQENVSPATEAFTVRRSATHVRKGHNEPGFAFERRPSGNLVSPVTPFTAVFGEYSPDGEVSDKALLPHHGLTRREGDSRPFAPALVIYKRHCRSGTICFSDACPVALITFFIETGSSASRLNLSPSEAGRVKTHLHPFSC